MLFWRSQSNRCAGFFGFEFIETAICDGRREGIVGSAAICRQSLLRVRAFAASSSPWRTALSSAPASGSPVRIPTRLCRQGLLRVWALAASASSPWGAALRAVRRCRAQAGVRAIQVQTGLVL